MKSTYAMMAAVAVMYWNIVLKCIKERGPKVCAACASLGRAVALACVRHYELAVAKANAADASKNFLKNKETAVARAEEDLKRRAARREKEDAAQIEAMEAMRAKLDEVEAREAAARPSTISISHRTSTPTLTS